MDVVIENLKTISAIAQGNRSLDTVLFGNELGSYATAAGVFVGLLIVFKIAQWLILHKLTHLAEQTKTDIDDAVIKIFRSLRPAFYSFLAFFIAIQTLALNDFVATAISVVLIVWVTYQVIAGSQILINHLIERGTAAGDPNAQSALRVLGRLLKGALWGIGILLILSNLGINISSLLAGIGIGGIAIAFALQNILADLFSSFAIYFDKPFVVGDFIVVGDHLGTVEKIGIKTTRLRALEGEEIAISNQELTSTRIQNYGRMEERRVVLSFGVVYETPEEKAAGIPEMVKEAVEQASKTRFDRAHFKEFGDSALVFEAVYYAKTADYNEHMDIKQDILRGIKKRLEDEKIAFAYPTQTVYVQK